VFSGILGVAMENYAFAQTARVWSRRS